METSGGPDFRWHDLVARRFWRPQESSPITYELDGRQYLLNQQWLNPVRLCPSRIDGAAKLKRVHVFLHRRQVLPLRYGSIVVEDPRHGPGTAERVFRQAGFCQLKAQTGLV